MKYTEVIILLWPIIASVLSFLFNLNFLFSTILFLGVPSLILSLVNPKRVKRVLLYSLIFASYGIIIDYIMEITGGWYIPYSVFDSFRLFGVITVDVLVWGFLYTYFVIMFYEVFLHHHCVNKLYYPHFKYLIILTLVSLGLFFGVYVVKPEFLNIDHFYLKLGLIFGITPVIFMLFKAHKVYTKLLKAFAYFFYLSFIHEITALALNHWQFPNEKQFIGFINIMEFRIPLEEIIFWILIGVLTIIALYEYYDDDWKYK